MKNFNLLRKSERKSVGTTLALTVGSPSFDRRGTMLKHYAFMLLFLLGSLNVWGGLSSPSACVFSASPSQTTLNDDNTDVTWTSSTAPSSFESVSPARGLQWGGTVVGGDDGLTLSCDSYTGKTITKIEIVWSRNNKAGATLTAKVGGADFGDAQSITGSKQSNAKSTFNGSASGNIEIKATSTATGNSFYVKSITVTFSDAGSTKPTVSVEPSSLEFGTVHASAEASKVFSVSGSNLTEGNLILTVPDGFSVKPISIAVDGTLAATNVTVSKNTSTIADYAGDLSITGGGLESAKTVALTMTVDADPAPTGTFELFSGDLEEGDYVLVYATRNNAMKASQAANDKRMDYAVVTPSENKIANPDASLVWHIAPISETSYWTIYSAEAEKYVGSTDANNQAKLLSGDLTDNMKWTVTSSDGKFDFSNVARVAANGSPYLRNNDNGTNHYGFACYANGTGGPLTLYKLSDGKEAAGLAFETAAYLVKANGSLATPTLTNPNNLTVTYTSSDANVVAVNETTGALTIKAAGKAEITASFTGDENYQAGSAKYTIYVAEQAGTAEDPLTEASAKALIDLGCTLRAHVKGTVLTPTYYSSSKTYTVTLTDGFQFYKLKDLGNELFTSDYLKANDQLVVLGSLGKHNTTYQLGDGCYIVNYVEHTEPLVDISNTKATAYTVAQALALAGNPTSDLSKAVYIAGVVYDVNSFSSANGTYNIYIKDAGTSEDDGKFEFYKCSGLYEVGGTPAQFEEGDVQIGDEVIGYGVMTYFSGGSIWEFGQPNQLVALNRPTVPVTSINLTESTATVEEGKTVSLHASVVPENASNKGITWSVQSGNDKAEVNTNGVVTGIAAGEAVVRATATADENIYAECTVTVTEPAPLSPWATVYSSNVTVGAEDYTIKILKPGSTTEYDEFEGMRYGTSNAPGVATITIPASTQALHFHAAAWNTETVTLEVKVGAETYPLTFGELVKEANIKGNGTTYELSTPIDEYYMLDLSSYTIADNTVITFTATGGNRFVLFGVNQEGGLVPVLDHIVVTGTATKLEYEVGDEFNPAGLGANAIYTLGGVELDPVAINAKDIEWSFEPATIAANTTSVTVTATYEGKSATKEVSGLSVTVPEPEIIVSAASLAFNNVAKEAAVADKELTVTLKSVENATLTITGDGASAFSVTPAALTASGTVAVSASSANVGTFNATLTISDDAGEAEAKTVALSITVEASDDLSGTWNLVTNAADLMPGMQVIIANIADENVVKTMGQQNSNNRAAVASTVAGTVLTPAAGTKVFTLVDAGNGKYALQLVNGNYLCAASSSSNNLKEQTTNDANGQWTITIADGKATITAQGSYSRKLMRFNPNNGNPLFACYAENSTTGTLVTLYAKPFDYSRNVSGNYATICLPKAGQIIGATLYEIAYYGEASKKIFFDEIVNGEMEAGIPYIFQPAAGVEKINVYYSDNTAEDVVAGNRNGLIGFYDLNDPAATHNIDQDAGFYILYNNQYWLVSGRAAYVENYRAYIKLADITPSEPTLAPGRRRISMSVNDTQTTTGFENAEANEAPRKVLINGELFILRGEKMYDAKGQLVK